MTVDLAVIVDVVTESHDRTVGDLDLLIESELLLDGSVFRSDTAYRRPLTPRPFVCSEDRREYRVDEREEVNLVRPETTNRTPDLTTEVTLRLRR